jgi:hypothetical protein
MREAAIMSMPSRTMSQNTRNLGTFYLAFVHALVGMKFVEV